MIKSLFIPKIFKYIVVRRYREYIVLFNESKSLAWVVNDVLKIESTLRSINILSNNSIFFEKLNEFLKNCAILQVKLIKFKGKGYKLTKTQSIISPLFSFSHIYEVIIRKVLVKKITKYKIAMLSSDVKYLSKFCRDYINKRKFDQYTVNGMRLKRQLIHRRKGKTLAS